MKKILLITAVIFLSLAQCSRGNTVLPEGLKNISVEEAAELIENKSRSNSFVILDVRTPGEFRSGHIEGAVNIDYSASDFRDEIKKLDIGKEYLVYCRTGNRSGRSLPIFAELGFKKVYNMTGGTVLWSASGMKLIR